MKQIELTHAFGLSNLRERSMEKGTLKPDEIRISTAAASLNYRDLLMIEGKYNPRQPLPLVPLSDGVGTITEVGSSVTERHVGERVCGLFCQSWDQGDLKKSYLAQTLGGPLPGMWRQEVILPANGVIEVPDYLSDEEAATLPCAALTAWSALMERCQTQEGQWVVCLGTGGVSLFAMQIANALGAHTIVLTSSDEKAKRVKRLGCDETINYTVDDRWDKRVREITGGDGADHVIEVGGAGTFDRSVRSLRPDGHMSLIGVLAAGHKTPNLTAVLMHQIRVQGIFVGHKQGFHRMNSFFQEHQIRPVIDSVHDGFAGHGALTKMQQKGHFGKICLSLSER